MLQALLKLARQMSGDPAGTTPTSAPWLRVMSSTSSRQICNLISRPTICLVLQGRMRQTVANQVGEVVSGGTLLLSDRTPALTEVVGASIAEPHISLLIDIDFAIVASLLIDMEAAHSPVERSVDTDEELAITALQLIRLLQQPSSISVLHEPLVRALHYWMLAGEHGDRIKSLSTPDSALRQISRAIAAIRSDFAKPLPIDRLAAVAGMSSSAFHQHFRTATSMTPLQYQKTIRLTEARRMMLSEGLMASTAAFSVGYQSISQFTRDYRRMFGLPPVRDTTRSRASQTANALQLAATA